MSLLVKKDLCVIENDNLSVQINISKSKVSSFFIINKLNGCKICGEESSELFVINFKGGLFNERVNSRSLKISNVFPAENENCDILTIEFAPIKVKGSKLKLSLVYTLEKTARYIRKHIEIDAEKVSEKAVLDYIDFSPIVTGINLKTSCLPEQKSSHISGFALSLGQPVFISSLFIGCEFPATLNTIENSAVSVKYFSGKPLSELLDRNSKYISYNSVIGVAQSEDDTVLHLALYDYIEKISKPLKLRVQYNLWFDHMLNISSENIEQSFFEIEKAMTAVGSQPLDCFVVDDGWNDYKKGFWCFNNKFPNELYPASALAKSFGSSFGMWLGPRGGYTSDTVKFARQIEKAGNGFLNKRSHDIDVGSDKYIRKTSDLMSDYQKRFGLKYWKLDGFIQKPCRNSNHDHIVGGFNDMYYYSEVWEKWLGVFGRLEEESEDGVFINLTCYAPPSPWMLQWVNCMWIQVSDDIGMTDKDSNGNKIGGSKKDMLLTYRDDRYYDFLKERKYSFPQSRIYNHDPIYANEANVVMTDEEFREYLFSMAARGNAFWELYYSFNLMNEAKWRINNSVLCFVRENLHLLKNSVMFGAKPSDAKVYGFGAFNKDEGMVMLRNSGSTPQNYVLRIDETIGASDKLQNAKTVVFLPYNASGQQGSVSFKDTINVALAPFQTKIYLFAKSLPEIKTEYVRAVSNNKLEVMFNQHIIPDEIACKENKIVSCKLLDDYRSVILEFENEFKQSQVYTLCTIQNIYLESFSEKVEFEYYENGLVPDKTIHGNSEFSIVVTTGGEEVGTLFKQGDEIDLRQENGKWCFRVGNQIVHSEGNVHDIVQVCAVRERNGVLKLYLNKRLDSGANAPKLRFNLKGEDVYCFDSNKVKVYNKALSYTEV